MKILGLEVSIRHFPADQYAYLVPWRMKLRLWLRRRKITHITVAYLMRPPRCSSVGTEIVSIGQAYCSAVDTFCAQKGELLAIRRAFAKFVDRYPQHRPTLVRSVREQYEQYLDMIHPLGARTRA